MAAVDTVQSAIDAISTVTQPLQASVTSLEQAKTEFAAELQAKFEEGKAEGAKEQGVDKIYSKEELDQAVAAAVEAAVKPVSEELEALKASQEQLVADAGAQAVAAFKVELKAKYDEQQVAEQQGETGFAALLQ